MTKPMISTPFYTEQQIDKLVKENTEALSTSKDYNALPSSLQGDVLFTIAKAYLKDLDVQIKLSLGGGELLGLAPKHIDVVRGSMLITWQHLPTPEELKIQGKRGILASQYSTSPLHHWGSIALSKWFNTLVTRFGGRDFTYQWLKKAKHSRVLKHNLLTLIDKDS